jgi:hypothetical protein
MRKSKLQRLSLSRETLQQLNLGGLDRVAGGLTMPVMSCAELCDTRTGAQSSCLPAC